MHAHDCTYLCMHMTVHTYAYTKTYHTYAYTLLYTGTMVRTQEHPFVACQPACPKHHRLRSGCVIKRLYDVRALAHTHTNTPAHTHTHQTHIHTLAEGHTPAYKSTQVKKSAHAHAHTHAQTHIHTTHLQESELGHFCPHQPTDQRPRMNPYAQLHGLVVVGHQHRLRLTQHGLGKLHDAHGIASDLRVCSMCVCVSASDFRQEHRLTPKWHSLGKTSA